MKRVSVLIDMDEDVKQYFEQEAKTNMRSMRKEMEYVLTLVARDGNTPEASEEPSLPPEDVV